MHTREKYTNDKQVSPVGCRAYAESGLRPEPMQSDRGERPGWTSRSGEAGCLRNNNADTFKLEPLAKDLR